MLRHSLLSPGPLARQRPVRRRVSRVDAEEGDGRVVDARARLAPPRERGGEDDEIGDARLAAPVHSPVSRSRNGERTGEREGEREGDGRLRRVGLSDVKRIGHSIYRRISAHHDLVRDIPEAALATMESFDSHAEKSRPALDLSVERNLAIGKVDV